MFPRIAALVLALMPAAVADGQERLVRVSAEPAPRPHSPVAVQATRVVPGGAIVPAVQDGAPPGLWLDF